jgi:hypothetical protein
MLKKAFNLACREWEWAKDNPVCRVSMERAEQYTGSMADMNRRKRRLLAAAAPWLQEVITFAIHTGMRCGRNSCPHMGRGGLQSTNRHGV